MIKEKIGMIPRYNWDYKLTDLAKALSGIRGSELDAERRVERIFGKKPIFTTSGRTSLYVILRSLHLPEGSNVGVPLFCCPVVFDAIKQASYVPKFIDVELDDYNLSATDLEKKKRSLSAVIVIHMFGNPADLVSISETCGNIPIIEDCAQSLFSSYEGGYTGFQSAASFFSFRSGKYISAGEGSVIFCRDSLLRESIRNRVETLERWTLPREISHCIATYLKSLMYHKPWYGSLGHPIGRLLDGKFNLTGKTGFNLRKISKVDLKIIEDRIDRFLSRVNKQRENAYYLLETLKLENAHLPRNKDGYLSNYYQFPIRFDNSEQRDFVADYLERNGIDAAKYLDDVVGIAKDHYGYHGDCPKAERCSTSTLVIPNHYNLPIKALRHIARTINAANDSLKKLL